MERKKTKKVSYQIAWNGLEEWLGECLEEILNMKEL
jgi:hypothetical protein